MSLDAKLPSLRDKLRAKEVEEVKEVKVPKVAKEVKIKKNK